MQIESLKAKIINIAEHVRKEDAKEMYRIIEGEEDRIILYNNLYIINLRI